MLLDAPICVRDDLGADTQSQSNVIVVQLAALSVRPKTVYNAVGHRAVVTGSLFRFETRRHRTPVLLDVSSQSDRLSSARGMIARIELTPIDPDRIMDLGKEDVGHGKLSEVQCTDGSRIHCRSQPWRFSPGEQLDGRRTEKSVLEQHKSPG